MTGSSDVWATVAFGYIRDSTVHWTGDVAPAGDLSPTFDGGIVCRDPFGGDVVMSH